MSNELSEMQERFFERFVELAKEGIPKQEALRDARDYAGYGSDIAFSKILGSPKLAARMVDYAREQLNLSVPYNIAKLESVVDNPAAKGSRQIIEATEKMLKMAGVAAPDKIEHNISGDNAIIILPPKDDD